MKRQIIRKANYATRIMLFPIANHTMTTSSRNLNRFMALLVATAFLVTTTLSFGLVDQNSHRTFTTSRTTRLSVASQDIQTKTTPVEKSKDETKAEVDGDDAVPYAISRGDGSTGGGGLPMPKPDEGEEHLIRPKVGAEMPKG